MAWATGVGALRGKEANVPDNPCRECPFRRKSAAGWLGSHRDPAEITAIVLADEKFPCHLEVSSIQAAIIESTQDGDDDPGEDWAFQAAVAEAKPCVGAAAFLNNQCKLSHHPRVAVTQRAVGKRADVFAHRQEMEEHHRNPAWRKRRKSAVPVGSRTPAGNGGGERA